MYWGKRKTYFTQVEVKILKCSHKTYKVRFLKNSRNKDHSSLTPHGHYMRLNVGFRWFQYMKREDERRSRSRLRRPERDPDVLSPTRTLYLRTVPSAGETLLLPVPPTCFLNWNQCSSSLLVSADCSNQSRVYQPPPDWHFPRAAAPPGWGGGFITDSAPPPRTDNPRLKPTDSVINDTSSGCDPCSLAVMPHVGSGELRSADRGETCTIMHWHSKAAPWQTQSRPDRTFINNKTYGRIY